jgi:MFS family permease
MSDTSTWNRSLAAVASGSAVPYGYTVTLWSSGAVLSHAHGAPDLVRVALFMASAIAGYNLFGAVARRWSAGQDEEVQGDVRVVAGMLNWFAVACAVAAWVCSHLPSAAAWALGPGVATAVYLTLSVAQLAGAESQLDA